MSEREALAALLRETAGEIKRCPAGAVVCPPCEGRLAAILAAADEYAASEVRAATEIGIAVKNRELAVLDAKISRLLSLFDSPDSWGMRRAVVTARTLERIVAEARGAEPATGEAEGNAEARADSGTADGTPEAGVAS